MTPAAARTVSVIIPTIGRDSLAAAVASARSQTGVEVDVLVVNDSGTPLDLPAAPSVRVLDTAGRTGSAAARNAGLAEITGEYFAFLDDDDAWLPGHLDRSVERLEAEPGAGLCFSRGLVLYGDQSSRVEPVEGLGSRTAAQYLLGRDNWRSRNRRILTPTLVARAAWGRHTMDPALECGEDTWWLLTAEAAGARVVYSDHVAVVVNADVQRDNDRRADDDQRAFADRLESLHPGTGASYLIARNGRAAARAGDVAKVLSWARAARDKQGFASWLPVIGVEAALAGVTTLRQKVRR